LIEPVDIRKYAAGNHWLLAGLSSQLWGVVLWGAPDERNTAAFFDAFVAAATRHPEPRATYVDATRFASLETLPFVVFERYLKVHGELATRAIARVAVVRPHGFEGAFVAGAFGVLAQPYPIRVFAATDEAVRWLATDVDLEGLAAMYREASRVPGELDALRALLADHLSLPLAKAARRLAVSERTLQRKLAELGTTYKDELADARVRAAKRLLVASESPLTAIAIDVGCGSLQNFSALFRRRTGESPSAFRARHKK